MGWAGIWSAIRRGGARRRGVLVKFGLKTKASSIGLLLAESLLLTPALTRATPRYHRWETWLTCVRASCWMMSIGTLAFYLAGGLDIAAHMPSIGPIEGKAMTAVFMAIASWVLLIGLIVLRAARDHACRILNSWARWPRVEPAPFGFYVVDSCSIFCVLGITLLVFSALAGVSAQPFWTWIGSGTPGATSAFLAFGVGVMAVQMRRWETQARFDLQVFGGRWNAIRSTVIVMGLPSALGAAWIAAMR